MHEPIKVSLSVRFLFLVLPVLFVVSLVFLAVLAYNELNNAERLSRQVSQDQASRVAYLLAEPVWQFSDTVSVTLLESVLEDPQILCIMLEYERSTRTPIRIGDCTEEAIGQTELFWAPVNYTHQGSQLQIGKVHLYTYVDHGWHTIAKEILQLAGLVIMLFMALALTTALAFRWTILRPLDRVFDSLRHYQRTGQRQPVNWSTTDELGLLITEYNESLKRQAESEQSAHSARELAEKALHNLKQAQEGLIQAEKLASLGSLVAGIAHEINTPVGNSVTVATSLHENTRVFRATVESGALKRSSLEQYLDNVDEATGILERNLHRAVEQVSNFKQVAVDQTSSQRRVFDLKEVVDEVMYTLRPRIKHTPHKVTVKIPAGLQFDSFPGPLGQVVTNCFNNTLLHGFEEVEAGEIVIDAKRLNDEKVRITLTDNGSGMEPEQLKKAFDPFYTTKLGKGGSGLGLHLVYNIVNGILGGRVQISSEPGAGLTVTLELPTSAPVQADRKGDV